MSLWAKGFKRSMTGAPRLEDKIKEGDCCCRSRVLITKTAKEIIAKQGLNVSCLLFNLNENYAKMGLERVHSILDETKRKIKSSNRDHVPNWDKPSQYLLADCDIWLVTEQDINHVIQVFNRFTREEEPFEIPDSRYEILPNPARDHLNDEDNPNLKKEEIPVATPDFLAFYANKSGCILFMVDRIKDYCDAKAFDNASMIQIYNMILLHELIHSCLDLYPRRAGVIYGYKGKWRSSDKEYTEESIDNALVLKCFEGKPGFDLVRDFIQNQPPYYSRGIGLYDDTDKLRFLLRALLCHKLGISIKTTPREKVERVLPALCSRLGNGFNKLKGNSGLYENSSGIRVLIHTSDDDLNPWTKLKWIKLDQFDYFCYVISDVGYLLIPVEELKKLGHHLDNEEWLQIHITLKCGIHFITRIGEENISVKEYFHSF